MRRSVVVDVQTSPVLERALSLTLPEQRTPEWHAMRRNYITGSAIDTVMGANPYETPTKLMLIKAGKPDDFKGNAATEHGSKYEDIARELYERAHSRRVMHVGLVPHPTHPLLAHSPDGLSVRCRRTRCGRGGGWMRSTLGRRCW
jgi:putative phage-type endonuclease